MPGNSRPRTAERKVRSLFGSYGALRPPAGLGNLMAMPTILAQGTPEQIARWAGCVGNQQTIVPITDAKHDVFLSLAGPRAAAYRELGRWLENHLGSESRSVTTKSERG